MNPPYSLTICSEHFNILHQHLFPGDQDEHGAVLSVGVSSSEKGTRLLVKDVVLAKDGVDYVPGKRGYRALTAQFVAEASELCDQSNCGYLAVHCHGGSDYVEFSQDDLDSHKRGYPALLQMLNEPVGALVFADNAVAGKIWTNDGIFDLNHVNIIGSNIRKLYQQIPDIEIDVNELYDRNVRVFGNQGQHILENITVGIIGLGGGGSLINEWISRLGVGHIIAVDFDKIEDSNIPRVVGSTKVDTMSFLSRSSSSILKRIGYYLSRYKVTIAKRIAKKSNPKIKFECVVGSVLDNRVALKLKDCDFIFLCTDNLPSRNVFNALLHQYLIPGAQIGAKVVSDKDSGKIRDINSAGKMIIPEPNGGCLVCNGWIPYGRLTKELESEEEQKAQGYVDENFVREPSVIGLNVLSGAHIVNDFMMMFTGMFQKDQIIEHVVYDVLNREVFFSELAFSEECSHCNPKNRRYAVGDRIDLPTKK